MSCHAGSNIAVSLLCTGHRSRRGVVNNGTVVQQAILKFFGAFANIVGQSCQMPVDFRAEGCRKIAAQFSRTN